MPEHRRVRCPHCHHSFHLPESPFETAMLNLFTAVVMAVIIAALAYGLLRAIGLGG
jgi:hypothetical protein